MRLTEGLKISVKNTGHGFYLLYAAFIILFLSQSDILISANALQVLGLLSNGYMISLLKIGEITLLHVKYSLINNQQFSEN